MLVELWGMAEPTTRDLCYPALLKLVVLMVIPKQAILQVNWK